MSERKETLPQSSPDAVEKYKGQAICRGSYALGTACDRCEKCREERLRYYDERADADAAIKNALQEKETVASVAVSKLKDQFDKLLTDARNGDGGCQCPEEGDFPEWEKRCFPCRTYSVLNRLEPHLAVTVTTELERADAAKECEICRYTNHAAANYRAVSIAIERELKERIKELEQKLERLQECREEDHKALEGWVIYRAEARAKIEELEAEVERLKLEKLSLQGNLGMPVPCGVELPEVTKNVLAECIAKERDRYREALEKIEQMDNWCEYCGSTEDVAATAREALSPKAST